MKAKTLLAPIALLAVIAMSVACAQKPNDEKITSTIQSSINADSGLQGKQLGVQSQGGVVTLTGVVDNDAQRSAASRYASAAPGVKQVVNDLQISGQTAPADTAQAQPMASAQPLPSAQPMPSPQPVAAEAAPAPKPTPEKRHHHARAQQMSNDMGNAMDTSSQMAQNQPPAQMPAADMPAAAPAPPPPPPPPQKVTIPSGTTVSVRLVDPVGSDTSQQGQAFHATLNSPLAVDGEVAIPAGYDVEGHVVDVENGGKFTGKAQLTLQLDRIIVGGKHYNVQTDTYHKETKSRTTNTAEKVGAGSVIGAIIGGIAGGGKGAAIGAAAGGGVGGGAQAAAKAPQVKLPSETVLTFTLQNSLTVTPTSQGPDAGRQKLDNQ